MAPTDFKTLLHQARAGDDEAIDQLVKQYERELKTVATARLGTALRPYLDSMDLVQSVHKSLMLGLRDDKFDIQSPEHLVRLALMMVRRKVARHWRKQRRQQRLDRNDQISCDGQSLASLILSLSKPTLDPSQEVELNEQLSCLFERLDDTERQLVQLRLEGCSTAEAAREMGLDPDPLRAKLSRLRRRIQSFGLMADWL